MADFDEILKSQQVLANGMSMFKDGMSSFAKVRATNQAQEELSALSNMEMEDGKRRQQQELIARNLVMNLQKGGVSTPDVQQLSGALMPTPLQNTDDWIKQDRQDTLKERETARQYDWKKTLFDRDTRLEVAGLKSVGGTKNKFTNELDKAQAKQFSKELESLSILDTGMSDADDALSALSEFGKGTINPPTKWNRGIINGGTGWLATFGGMQKYVSSDAEMLDAKLKTVDLKAMVKTFSGMSQAVNTETERAAWNATQASLTNDDDVNAYILLGAKSLMLKQKFELADKAAYAEENESLRNYKSRLSEVMTVMDDKGEMHLIPKKAFPQLESKGFMTVDKFAKKRFGKVGSSMGADPRLKSPSAASEQQQPQEQASPAQAAPAPTVNVNKYFRRPGS
jgi:hypothetical protein